MLDRERAGLVVADEEERAAALAGAVAGDDAAVNGHGVVVPVGVDRAAAAAARGAGLSRVGACADGAVTGEGAAGDHPGHPDAAQGAAIGAHAAGEGAAGDLDGPVLVLAQRPDGGPAQVRAGGVAAVAGEAGVDDRELAAAVEDGPAAPAVVDLPGGVAVGQGDVLHGQFGSGLVLAVRGGPSLGRVAGVLVQDAAHAAAAERDQAAAVQD